MKKLTLILALLMATTTMFAGESIIFQEPTKEVVKMDGPDGATFDITFVSGRLGNFATIVLTADEFHEMNEKGSKMQNGTKVTLSNGVELKRDKMGMFSLEENGTSVQLTGKMLRSMQRSLK